MESTIGITLKELKAHVSNFLGWGLGPDYDDSEWTDRQVFEIEEIIKSGLSRVYFPHQTEGPPYEWSWLRPTAELTFLQDTSSLDLPDDYNGIDGEIMVSTNGTAWRSLKTVNPGILDQMHAENPTTSGYPRYAAPRPVKGVSKHKGTRWDLYFFPLADQDYTLRFRYHLLPEMLTIQNPYPLGGAMMREVFLESCLAVAEQRPDYTSSVHSQEFDRRIAAAIGQDRRHKPEYLGYNADRSGQQFNRRGTQDNWYTVTVNGVTPT